jgi:hypothetical protein
MAVVREGKFQARGPLTLGDLRILVANATARN